MECGVSPSRRCLCCQPLAPIGLDKSKAAVDASVFPQLKQSLIPNRTTRATVQDDPLAEAVCSLVLLIVS
jgi:hypothetical protein